MESLASKLFEGITSQCGLGSAVFFLGWCLTMWQLAKERAGRENDREKARISDEKMAEAQRELKNALSEIHGYLMAWKPRNIR